MRSCYGISKWGLLLGQAARVTFLFGALQRNVSTPKPSGRVGGWTEHPPGSEVIGIARWPEAFQFVLSLAIGRCSAGVSQQHANVPPHYGDLWQQVWCCGQLGIKPEGTCSSRTTESGYLLSCSLPLVREQETISDNFLLQCLPREGHSRQHLPPLHGPGTLHSLDDGIGFHGSLPTRHPPGG